jgi:uncharacterized protein
VVFRKYDDSLHWHATLRRLGEDEHGVWLGARAGTLWQRNTEEPVAMNHAHVSLFPRDAWWVASFNSAPAALDIYCDITDAPVWPTAQEVTMVDLDLDVIRVRATGAVEVIDEDEFAEHQVRYAYPDDVIRRARDAADHLAAMLNCDEPFTAAYRPWLDLVA